MDILKKKNYKNSDFKSEKGNYRNSDCQSGSWILALRAQKRGDLIMREYKKPVVTVDQDWQRESTQPAEQHRAL